MILNLQQNCVFDPPPLPRARIHRFFVHLSVFALLLFVIRAPIKCLLNKPNAQKQNKDTHYKETIIHRLEQTRKRAGWPGPRSSLAAARSSDSGESSVARASDWRGAKINTRLEGLPL